MNKSKMILALVILSLVYAHTSFAQIPEKQIYMHLKKIAEDEMLMKLKSNIGHYGDWHDNKKILSIVMKGKKVYNPEMILCLIYIKH